MFSKTKVGIIAISLVGFIHPTYAGSGQDPVTDGDFFNNGNPNSAEVELGKKLFFDKVISGNQNTSCATCHHTLTDTGDGLSLPVGEGGRGLGVSRETGSGADAIHERVPRNAPPVFNLGANEFHTMFYDGRVQADDSQPSGFASPAGDDLPLGLNNALAAQALFPITSGAEMAGQAGENPQADAASTGNLAGIDGVWAVVISKLKAIPEYVDMFVAAYDDVDGVDDITITHYGNAVAAFEGEAWRFDNSPYDRFLRGDRKAMSTSAKRGLKLFNKKAGCAECHSGAFQSDQSFHAIAMPQIGPGKGDNLSGYSDGHDDFGRERVTGTSADRFKFRTPTLRNIELTAPYGHSGAYDTLEAIVRHHMDPINSLENYDQSQAVLISRDDLDALDFVVMNDPTRVEAIADANELAPVKLNNRQVGHLIDFLRALTDPNAIDLRFNQPKTVPSGLTLVE